LGVLDKPSLGVEKWCPGPELNQRHRDFEGDMPVLPTHARKVAAITLIDGARTEYRSTEVEGLVLECLPSCKRTWRLRYHVGRGKLRQQRKFEIGNADNVTLAQAEKRARELLAQVQVEGRDPQAEKHAPAESDFSSVVQSWTEWQEGNGKRSWKRNISAFAIHVKAHLGATPP
jgi:Arm DNA-binding domain